MHIPYPHDPKYRYVDTDQVLQELRPRFFAVPGIMAFMQNPPPIQIGGRLTKSQYQFTLQGPDTKELYREAGKLEGELRSVPGLQDVTTDLQVSNPQVNVEIDRDKANALGVSAFQVEDALETAYSSRQISTIYTPNNEYWVMAELLPKYQMDPQALSLLYIRSSSGQLVPLSAVSKLTQSLGPLAVNHSGQLPSVTVSFNLQPGTALGDAVNRVEQVARQTLPSDLSANFEGTAQQFQSSLVGMGVLLVITILVIYIVLGILYESFIHPLTILSGLPSAALGALLTLKYFGYELDLYGFVGIIMLVGIVKKNAIMMIDFALDAERTSGKTTQDAIYYGALVRFRPIMMTTMAALMGTLPIARGFWRRSGSAPSPGPLRRGRAGLFPTHYPVHHSCLLHLPRCIPKLAATTLRQQGSAFLEWRTGGGDQNAISSADRASQKAKCKRQSQSCVPGGSGTVNCLLNGNHQSSDADPAL